MSSIFKFVTSCRVVSAKMEISENVILNTYVYILDLNS